MLTPDLLKQPDERDKMWKHRVQSAGWWIDPDGFLYEISKMNAWRLRKTMRTLHRLASESLSANLAACAWFIDTAHGEMALDAAMRDYDYMLDEPGEYVDGYIEAHPAFPHLIARAKQLQGDGS